MATASATLNEDATAVFRDTARSLEGDLDLLVDQVSTMIMSQVPGVLDCASYRSSNLANLNLKLELLQRGGQLAVPPPPREAVLYARELAWRGADLSVLMRSYELGHRYFWRIWTQQFATRADPLILGDLYEASAGFLFEYFDEIPAALSSEYHAELVNCRAGGTARHAELVCQLLGDADQDVDAAEQTLCYPLRGGHVALVLASPSGALTAQQTTRVQRSVAGLARAVHGQVLVVQVEAATLWAWVEVPATCTPERLDAVVDSATWPDGIVVAIGDLGRGQTGFADSHREASLALRLRGAAGNRRGRAVRYRTISAASLLCSDLPRARRFVERELGALARGDEPTERLRSTLRAYLVENCNQAKTARRLGIHYNTLVYRLRQIETLLGHSTLERRFEVEAALMLHGVVGT